MYYYTNYLSKFQKVMLGIIIVANRHYTSKHLMKQIPPKKKKVQHTMLYCNSKSTALKPREACFQLNIRIKMKPNTFSFLKDNKKFEY